MQLTNLLTNNFFSVLSSSNREIYLDCIFIIYNSLDSLEDSFQGDKDFIIGKLTDYFDSKQNNDLEFDDEIYKTSRQKAVVVINILKKYGWLGEEELGDYKVSLNFFDHSLKIIESLEEIKNSKKIEYTGEIYLIYSLLASFTIPEGIGIIEQVYLKTIDITKRLKSLKANIYRYYYDISKNKNNELLKDLLESLLIEYKENFFDSAYYNLKTKDSLPKYKQTILAKLSAIYDNDLTMDLLTKEVIKIKKINDYNEAYNFIEKRIRFINDSFAGLENLIVAIDKKNEQYISATSAKILFLANHSDNIEGIFNRLFKILLSNQKIDYNVLFNLLMIKNIDSESLYKKRKTRVEPIAEDIIFDPSLITEDYKKAKIAPFFKNGKFAKEEINSYALSLLLDKKEVKASEIVLDTDIDYIRLILIFLYSKSYGISYFLEPLNKEALVGKIRFNDFLIKKR